MNPKAIDHVIETEVLVVGGGLAGCFAALKCNALGRKVVVAEKGYVSICQSRWPGANISVCLPGDDKDLWLKEFVVGGEYLNDQEWVKIQIEDAYPLLEELDRWGRELNLPIMERDAKGDLLKAKVHGDVNTENCILNGGTMMDTLRKKLIQDKVVFFDRMMLSDLISNGDRVKGAVGFDYRKGETYLFKAKAVILAAAGCSFRFDPRRLHMTGEGQVMAYEAGARLRNLDQCEAKRVPRYSVSIRGGMSTDVHFGGRFLNALDEEFMWKYDPKLGNRSMNRTDPFTQEVAEGRGPIYWDYTKIPSNIQEMYRRIAPVLLKGYESMGIKVFDEKIDTSRKDFIATYAGPHSGSSGGGVDIDTSCATSIKGLYAVGDNTCSPHQGTHPFGGQNLAFCLTSGNRAANAVSEYVISSPDSAKKEMTEQAKEKLFRLAIPLTRAQGLTPEEITWKIQTIMVPYRKSYTHKEPLEKALNEIMKLKEEDLPQVKASDPHGLINALGVRSMFVIAEAILKSVLLREETRGKNIRKDFPLTDNINWLKWVVVEKKGEEMKVSAEDVPTPYIQAPRSKYRPKRESSDLEMEVPTEDAKKQADLK